MTKLLISINYEDQFSLTMSQNPVAGHLTTDVFVSAAAWRSFTFNTTRVTSYTLLAIKEVDLGQILLLK